MVTQLAPNKMTDFIISYQQAKVANARCHLLMGSWEDALEAAEIVLADDKYNIKSIFVKAEALFNLCLFEHSLVHFHRGLVRFKLHFYPKAFICQNSSLEK
jgi:hypothetical protein